MEFSHLSLLAGFAMLVFGVLEYSVLHRLLYRRMRDRHEERKTTGSHGRDPGMFWAVFKFINLVVLPALGLIFGHAILAPFFG